MLLLESSPRPASHWAAVALGVLTILYVVVIRPMRKGRRNDPLDKMRQAPATPTTLAQQRALERDMAAVLVEYEGMIRRMTAQLDTRATKLQLLIDEADAKLVQLKQATAGRGATEAQSPAGVTSETAGEAAGANNLQPTPSAPAANAPAHGDEDTDNSHADVYGLADRGRSPRQIAEELNRPDGEIELILALRHARP